MATNEELLQQLEQLKAKRDAIVAKKMQAPEQGFIESSIPSLGDVGKNITNTFSGVGNLLSVASKNNETLGGSPFTAPLAVGQAMYSGVNDWEGFKKRTNDMVLGAVPGARSAYNAAADYLSDKADDFLNPNNSNVDALKPASEYGGMLKQDLASLPLLGAFAGANKLGSMRSASTARNAAKAEALADPTSQAALRYANNAGIMDASTQAAWEKGKLTPELQTAAQQAQEHALLTQTAGVDRGMDYLPGTALGYPENNSARSFAASEDMASAGKTMIDSGVYTGGERINPFTGKFEGPAVAPLDNYALAQKLETASADIIQARQGTVNALDQAMNDINSLAKTPEQAVAPITFAEDVAPALGDLQAQINKRSTLVQTQPMSAGMAEAYGNVERSFRQIYQGLSGIGERGVATVRTTEALGMIENMNAYRRALGEFDEASRAAGLNSTFSDFAGRGAELESLSKVQGALQKALESKAAEILQKKGIVAEPKEWQAILAQVTPETLPGMNRNYGAFQTGKEAATTYGNTTMRGAVAPEGGRLIGATQQRAGSDIAIDAAAHPIRETARAGMNALGFGPRTPTPMSDLAARNLSRPKAAISQVLDGLLLREKSIPILSRSWEQIQASPIAMKEVATRAYMYGILPEGVFETLSDPLKKEVAKQVIQLNPAGAEKTAGNYQVFDGEYQNPMEKDAVIREKSKASPEERMKWITSAWQNKIPEMPLGSQQPVTQEAKLPDIDSLNSLFSGMTRLPQMAPQKTDAQSMVDELMRVTALQD